MTEIKKGHIIVTCNIPDAVENIYGYRDAQNYAIVIPLNTSTKLHTSSASYSFSMFLKKDKEYEVVSVEMNQLVGNPITSHKFSVNGFGVPTVAVPSSNKQPLQPSTNGWHLHVELKLVGEEVGPEPTPLELATQAVEKAETSKLQADKDEAQSLVSALVDSAEKTALQERLDAIVIDTPVTYNNTLYATTNLPLGIQKSIIVDTRGNTLTFNFGEIS